MSQRKDKNNGIRSMQGSIRAMEGEGNERKFIISFSSEEPYERWFGTEILSHDAGAVDLTRLNEIGVVLFNHNVNKVVGKILRAGLLLLLFLKTEFSPIPFFFTPVLYQKKYFV